MTLKELTTKVPTKHRPPQTLPSQILTPTVCLFGKQALKILKTSEFMPFVVFIAAPEFETLKAMHKAVVDAGITTKQLTVSP